MRLSVIDEVQTMASNPVIKPQSGEILATGVTFEEYLERFSGMHCELVDGNVIKMSPATLQHQNIFGYLYLLLSAYFDFTKYGQVLTQPFTQRLPNVGPKREPDLMIVLVENIGRIQETFLDGPADICIEIVSEESTARDRITKLNEYQKGGVKEYWVLDYIQREALFYALNAAGQYELQGLEDMGYRTSLLPSFVLYVPTLWQKPLPGLSAISSAVQEMLK
jgi:Uma2 family endonuclease